MAVDQAILDAGTDDAIVFLRMWQPKGPWNLTAILEGDPVQNKTFMPDDEAGARAWLKARNGRRNLYFTVNDTKPAQARKPKKEHMVRARAFHVDIDPVKGADLKDEQARIKTLIKAFPIKPTIAIFSGGGYQLFWKLKARIDLDENKVEEIEDVNRRIERLITGSTQCWNVDRIMRLPGTLNIPNRTKRKAGRKPVMSRLVLAKWERVYAPDVFEDLPLLPEGVAPWIGMVILTGERPDRDEPYPSRSEASYAVLCELKRKGMDVEDMKGILLNPDFDISAHILDQGDPEKYFERQFDKADVEVEDEAGDDDQPDDPKLWDDYIFVRDQEQFYDKRKDFWVSKNLFNDEFVANRTRGKESRTPMQRFIETRDEQCVDKTTWDPSLAYGRVEYKGLWLWNAWKEPTWFGAKGDGNIKPWLDVCKIVYAEYWELAVKRMAYDIQFPSLRPQWHLQAIGENGIGKSDSIMPLTRWAERLGLWVGVRNDMLKSQFNGFMSKKKIIVHNEPSGITDAVFNELKDMLAGHENRISIRSLYENPRDEAIVASWYFGGNKANGLSLTTVERRVFPVHSRAPTPNKENGLLDIAVKRHRWIRTHWPQVVWYLRNKVKVDKNFGNVFPGVNKYQKQIASNTAPLHMRLKPYIEEVIGDREIFTMSWVAERVAIIDDLPVEDHRRDLNNKIFSQAFDQMGITRFAGGQQFRVGPGNPKRLWIRDSALEKLTREDLQFLWEMQGGEKDLEDESDEMV